MFAFNETIAARDQRRWRGGIRLVLVVVIVIPALSLALAPASGAERPVPVQQGAAKTLVVLGSFSTRSNALRLRRNHADVDLQVVPVQIGQARYFRVVARVAVSDDRKNTRRDLASRGITNYWMAAPCVKGKRVPNCIATQDRPNRRMIARIQAALTELEYETGPVDGMTGVRTRAAIDDYQRDNPLVADSHPTRALLRHIRQNQLSRIPY